MSAASTDELIAIKQALTSSIAEISEVQAVHDLEQAAPRLAGVARLIRNRDSRIELAIWLTLLAAVIVPILIAIKANHNEITPQRQDQIIQVIVPPPTAIPATPSPAGRHEPGRNEQCPCGSGRKYKHCHGSPTARP